MAIDLTSAVTGAAITGLTTPGYTLTADTPPDINAKQSAVTGLTGTQTGVTSHSVASPFTVSAWRPKAMQMLGKPDPTTGLISRVPNNTYKVITRKGVTPALNQPAKVLLIRTEIDVPAGSDTYDLINLKAAISAHCGLLFARAQGLADTGNSGIL